MAKNDKNLQDQAQKAVKQEENIRNNIKIIQEQNAKAGEILAKGAINLNGPVKEGRLSDAEMKKRKIGPYRERLQNSKKENNTVTEKPVFRGKKESGVISYTPEGYIELNTKKGKQNLFNVASDLGGIDSNLVSSLEKEQKEILDLFMKTTQDEAIALKNALKNILGKGANVKTNIGIKQLLDIIEEVPHSSSIKEGMLPNVIQSKKGKGQRTSSEIYAPEIGEMEIPKPIKRFATYEKKMLKKWDTAKTSEEKVAINKEAKENMSPTRYQSYLKNIVDNQSNKRQFAIDEQEQDFFNRYDSATTDKERQTVIEDAKKTMDGRTKKFKHFKNNVALKPRKIQQQYKDEISSIQEKISVPTINGMQLHEFGNAWNEEEEKRKTAESVGDFKTSKKHEEKQRQIETMVGTAIHDDMVDNKSWKIANKVAQYKYDEDYSKYSKFASSSINAGEKIFSKYGKDEAYAYRAVVDVKDYEDRERAYQESGYTPDREVFEGKIPTRPDSWIARNNSSKKTDLNQEKNNIINEIIKSISLKDMNIDTDEEGNLTKESKSLINNIMSSIKDLIKDNGGIKSQASLKDDGYSFDSLKEFRDEGREKEFQSGGNEFAPEYIVKIIMNQILSNLSKTENQDIDSQKMVKVSDYVNQQINKMYEKEGLSIKEKSSDSSIVGNRMAKLFTVKKTHEAGVSRIMRETGMSDVEAKDIFFGNNNLVEQDEYDSNLLHGILKKVGYDANSDDYVSKITSLNKAMDVMNNLNSIGNHGSKELEEISRQYFDLKTPKDRQKALELFMNQTTKGAKSANPIPEKSDDLFHGVMYEVDKNAHPDIEEQKSPKERHQMYYNTSQVTSLYGRSIVNDSRNVYDVDNEGNNPIIEAMKNKKKQIESELDMANQHHGGMNIQDYDRFQNQLNEIDNSNFTSSEKQKQKSTIYKKMEEAKQSYQKKMTALLSMIDKDIEEAENLTSDYISWKKKQDDKNSKQVVAEKQRKQIAKNTDDDINPDLNKSYSEEHKQKQKDYDDIDWDASPENRDKVIGDYQKEKRIRFESKKNEVSAEDKKKQIAGTKIVTSSDPKIISGDNNIKNNEFEDISGTHAENLQDAITAEQNKKQASQQLASQLDLEKQSFEELNQEIQNHNKLISDASTIENNKQNDFKKSSDVVKQKISDMQSVIDPSIDTDLNIREVEGLDNIMAAPTYLTKDEKVNYVNRQLNQGNVPFTSDIKLMDVRTAGMDEEHNYVEDIPSIVDALEKLKSKKIDERESFVKNNNYLKNLESFDFVDDHAIDEMISRKQKEGPKKIPIDFSASQTGILGMNAPNYKDSAKSQERKQIVEELQKQGEVSFKVDGEKQTFHSIQELEDGTGLNFRTHQKNAQSTIIGNSSHKIMELLANGNYTSIDEVFQSKEWNEYLSNDMDLKHYKNLGGNQEDFLEKTKNTSMSLNEAMGGILTNPNISSNNKKALAEKHLVGTYVDQNTGEQITMGGTFDSIVNGALTDFKTGKIDIKKFAMQLSMLQDLAVGAASQGMLGDFSVDDINNMMSKITFSGKNGEHGTFETLKLTNTQKGEVLSTIAHGLEYERTHNDLSKGTFTIDETLNLASGTKRIESEKNRELLRTLTDFSEQNTQASSLIKKMESLGFSVGERGKLDDKGRYGQTFTRLDDTTGRTLTVDAKFNEEGFLLESLRGSEEYKYEDTPESKYKELKKEQLKIQQKYAIAERDELSSEYVDSLANDATSIASEISKFDEFDTHKWDKDLQEDSSFLEEQDKLQQIFKKYETSLKEELNEYQKKIQQKNDLERKKIFDGLSTDEQIQLDRVNEDIELIDEDFKDNANFLKDSRKKEIQQYRTNVENIEETRNANKNREEKEQRLNSILEQRKKIYSQLINLEKNGDYDTLSEQDKIKYDDIITDLNNNKQDFDDLINKSVFTNQDKEDAEKKIKSIDKADYTEKKKSMQSAVTMDTKRTRELKNYLELLEKINKLERERISLENKKNKSGTKKAFYQRQLNELTKKEDEIRSNFSQYSYDHDGTFIANGETFKLNEKEKDSFNSKIADAQVRHNDAINLLHKKNQKPGFFSNFANTIKEEFHDYLGRGLTYELVGMLRQTVTSAINEIKEFDKIKIDLQIVTGYDKSQINDMISGYNQMAKELGVTTKEVATSANQFLRMGYTAEQAGKLIKQSMMLSKLGMLDAGQAAEYLTSAIKGYKLSAEESSKVVDIATTLDMSYAIDAGYILEAMSRTATSAQLAKVEMSELQGMIAVLGETTQKDASVIGESLKTGFARYGNVKAGIADSVNVNDLDEESKAELEKVNDIEKVLGKYNINIRESDNKTWRSYFDILKDINGQWEIFSDFEKNAITTAMFGTRQRENGLVILENFDKVLSANDKAMNAEGTGAKKYETYLTGLEAAQNRLTTAWENFVNKIKGSDALKGIYNLVSGLIENFDALSKIILTVVGALNAHKLFAGAGKFTNSFGGAIRHTLNDGKTIGKAIIGKENTGNVWKTIKGVYSDSVKEIQEDAKNKEAVYESQQVTLLQQILAELQSFNQHKNLDINDNDTISDDNINPNLNKSYSEEHKQKQKDYNDMDWDASPENRDKVIGDYQKTQREHWVADKMKGNESSNKDNKSKTNVDTNDTDFDKKSKKKNKTETQIDTSDTNNVDTKKKNKKIKNKKQNIDVGVPDVDIDSNTKTKKGFFKTAGSKVKQINRKLQPKTLAGANFANAAGGILGTVGAGLVGNATGSSTTGMITGIANTLVTALNPVAGAIMGIATTTIGGFFSYMKKKEEERIESAIKKSEESQKKVDKIEDSKEKFQRYDELAKGVNSLGQNVSLSNGEYDEFISLGNELGEAFPEMISCVDSAGNSLLGFDKNIGNTTEQLDSFIAMLKKQNMEDFLNPDNLKGLFDKNQEEVDKIHEKRNNLEHEKETAQYNYVQEVKKNVEKQSGGKSIYIPDGALTAEQLNDILSSGDVFYTDITDKEGNYEGGIYSKSDLLNLTDNEGNKIFTVDQLEEFEKQGDDALRSDKAYADGINSQIEKNKKEASAKREEYERRVASVIIEGTNPDVSNTAKTVTMDVLEGMVHAQDYKDDPETMADDMLSALNGKDLTKLDALNNMTTDIYSMNLSEAKKAIDEQLAVVSEVFDIDLDKARQYMSFDDGYEATQKKLEDRSSLWSKIQPQTYEWIPDLQNELENQLSVSELQAVLKMTDDEITKIIQDGEKQGLSAIQSLKNYSIESTRESVDDYSQGMKDAIKNITKESNGVTINPYVDIKDDEIIELFKIWKESGELELPLGADPSLQQVFESFDKACSRFGLDVEQFVKGGEYLSHLDSSGISTLTPGEFEEKHAGLYEIMGQIGSGGLNGAIGDQLKTSYSDIWNQAIEDWNPSQGPIDNYIYNSIDNALAMYDTDANKIGLGANMVLDSTSFFDKVGFSEVWGANTLGQFREVMKNMTGTDNIDIFDASGNAEKYTFDETMLNNWIIRSATENSEKYSANESDTEKYKAVLQNISSQLFRVGSEEKANVDNLINTGDFDTAKNKLVEAMNAQGSEIQNTNGAFQNLQGMCLILGDSMLSASRASISLSRVRQHFEVKNYQEDFAQTTKSQKKQERDYNKQIRDLNKQLDRFPRKEYQLDRSKQQLDRSKQQLSRSWEQLDRSKQQLDRSKQQLDRSKQQLDRTQQQIERSWQQLERSKQQLSRNWEQLERSKQQLNRSRRDLEKNRKQLEKDIERFPREVKKLQRQSDEIDKQERLNVLVDFLERRNLIIEEYNNKIQNAEWGLEILSSNDYEGRLNIEESKILSTYGRNQEIQTQLDVLYNINPKTAEEAQHISETINSLTMELQQNITSLIQYEENLSLLGFEMIAENINNVTEAFKNQREILNDSTQLTMSFTGIQTNTDLLGLGINSMINNKSEVEKKKQYYEEALALQEQYQQKSIESQGLYLDLLKKDNAEDISEQRQDLVYAAEDLLDTQEQFADRKEDLLLQEQDILWQEQDLEWQKQDLIWQEQDLIWQEQDIRNQEQDLEWQKQDLVWQEQDLIWQEQDLANQEQDLVWQEQDLVWQEQDLIWQEQDLIDEKNNIVEQINDAQESLLESKNNYARQYQEYVLGLLEMAQTLGGVEKVIFSEEQKDYLIALFEEAGETPPEFRQVDGGWAYGKENRSTKVKSGNVYSNVKAIPNEAGTYKVYDKNGNEKIVVKDENGNLYDGIMGSKSYTADSWNQEFGTQDPLNMKGIVNNNSTANQTKESTKKAVENAVVEGVKNADVSENNEILKEQSYSKVEEFLTTFVAHWNNHIKELTEQNNEGTNGIVFLLDIVPLMGYSQESVTEITNKFESLGTTAGQSFMSGLSEALGEEYIIDDSQSNILGGSKKDKPFGEFLYPYDWAKSSKNNKKSDKNKNSISMMFENAVKSGVVNADVSENNKELKKQIDAKIAEFLKTFSTHWNNYIDELVSGKNKDNSLDFILDVAPLIGYAEEDIPEIISKFQKLGQQAAEGFMLGLSSMMGSTYTPKTLGVVTEKRDGSRTVKQKDTKINLPKKNTVTMTDSENVKKMVSPLTKIFVDSFKPKEMAENMTDKLDEFLVELVKVWNEDIVDKKTDEEHTLGKPELYETWTETSVGVINDTSYLFGAMYQAIRNALRTAIDLYEQRIITDPAFHLERPNLLETGPSGWGSDGLGKLMNDKVNEAFNSIDTSSQTLSAPSLNEESWKNLGSSISKYIAEGIDDGLLTGIVDRDTWVEIGENIATYVSDGIDKALQSNFKNTSSKVNGGAAPAHAGTSTKKGGNKQSASGDEILKTAASKEGLPYIYGGTDPLRGFDCSGLTQWAMAQHGIQIPRVAEDQYRQGDPVAKEDLQVGDLVFFSNDGTNITHVGIYAGNNQMFHAPSTGKTLRYQNIDTPYYTKNYVGARRYHTGGSVVAEEEDFKFDTSTAIGRLMQYKLDQYVEQKSNKKDVLNPLDNFFTDKEDKKDKEKEKDIVYSADNTVITANDNNDDDEPWWKKYWEAGKDLGKKIFFSYAKGSKYHKGGKALLGDENFLKGSTKPSPETLIYPSGEIEVVGQDGPVIKDIPQGTQVLTFKETKKLFNNIPSYAKGTEVRNAETEQLENIKEHNSKGSQVTNLQDLDINSEEYYISLSTKTEGWTQADYKLVADRVGAAVKSILSPFVYETSRIAMINKKTMDYKQPYIEQIREREKQTVKTEDRQKLKSMEAKYTTDNDLRQIYLQENMYQSELQALIDYYKKRETEGASIVELNAIYEEINGLNSTITELSNYIDSWLNGQLEIIDSTKNLITAINSHADVILENKYSLGIIDKKTDENYYNKRFKNIDADINAIQTARTSAYETIIQQQIEAGSSIAAAIDYANKHESIMGYDKELYSKQSERKTLEVERADQKLTDIDRQSMYGDFLSNILGNYSNKFIKNRYFSGANTITAETLEKINELDNQLEDDSLNLSYEERIARIDQRNTYIVEYFNQLKEGIDAINEASSNAYNSANSLIDYQENLGIKDGKGTIRLRKTGLDITNSTYYSKKIKAEEQYLSNNQQALADAKQVARNKYLTMNPYASESQIETYLKTETSVVEARDKVYESMQNIVKLRKEELDYQIALIDREKELLDLKRSERWTSKEDIDDFYNTSDIFIKRKIQQLKAYIEMKNLSKEEYNNTVSEIANLEKELFNNETQRLKDIQEFYSSQYDSMNFMVNEYIEALNLEKETINETYDEEIRKLEQVNNQKERSIKLTELQTALDNARKEKKRVYRAGVGFVYEDNREAIDEAEKALDDFYKDDRLQSLNKAKELELKALDERINGWNKYLQAIEKVYQTAERHDHMNRLEKAWGVTGWSGIWNNLDLDLSDYLINEDNGETIYRGSQTEFLDDYIDISEDIYERMDTVVDILQDISNYATSSDIEEVKSTIEALPQKFKHDDTKQYNDIDYSAYDWKKYDKDIPDFYELAIKDPSEYQWLVDKYGDYITADFLEAMHDQKQNELLNYAKTLLKSHGDDAGLSLVEDFISGSKTNDTGYSITSLKTVRQLMLEQIKEQNPDVYNTHIDKDLGYNPVRLSNEILGISSITDEFGNPTSLRKVIANADGTLKTNSEIYKKLQEKGISDADIWELINNQENEWRENIDLFLNREERDKYWADLWEETKVVGGYTDEQIEAEKMAHVDYQKYLSSAGYVQNLKLWIAKQYDKASINRMLEDGSWENSGYSYSELSTVLKEYDDIIAPILYDKNIDLLGLYKQFITSGKNPLSLNEDTFKLWRDIKIDWDTTDYQRIYQEQLNAGVPEDEAQAIASQEAYNIKQVKKAEIPESRKSMMDKIIKTVDNIQEVINNHDWENYEYLNNYDKAFWQEARTKKNNIQNDNIQNNPFLRYMIGQNNSTGLSDNSVKYAYEQQMKLYHDLDRNIQSLPDEYSKDVLGLLTYMNNKNLEVMNGLSFDVIRQLRDDSISENLRMGNISQEQASLWSRQDNDLFGEQRTIDPNMPKLDYVFAKGAFPTKTKLKQDSIKEYIETLKQLDFLSEPIKESLVANMNNSLEIPLTEESTRFSKDKIVSQGNGMKGIINPQVQEEHLKKRDNIINNYYDQIFLENITNGSLAVDAVNKALPMG